MSTNGKNFSVTRQPPMGQPLEREAISESVGTPTHVGISTLMQNWNLHGLKMEPFHDTVKRFVGQGRLPRCGNFSPKMMKITNKKGEQVDIIDPWSYRDGKHQAEEMAIETWALYDTRLPNRKFTWAQMEGARMACWFFLKDWIKYTKNASSKRQCIFGTCFMLLCAIEDETTKKVDAICDKIHRRYGQAPPPSEKILPAPTPFKLVSQLSVEALSYALEEVADIPMERARVQKASVSYEKPLTAQMVTVSPPVFTSKDVPVSTGFSPMDIDAFDREVAANLAEVSDLFKNLKEHEEMIGSGEVEEEEPMEVEEIKPIEMNPYQWEFSHYLKLKSQAVIEAQLLLQKVDPLNLTCKCWNCVERFLRRNPYALHNQINVCPDQCLYTNDFVDKTERARLAHRARCLEVLTGRVSEYQMCSHEVVDWANTESQEFFDEEYEDMAQIQGSEECVSLDDLDLNTFMCEIELDYFMEQAGAPDWRILWVTDEEPWSIFEQEELHQLYLQMLEDESEELPFAQMDECLESHESVEKTQNLTFVDERPVDRAGAYLGSSSRTYDINRSIAEKPWTLNATLDREIPVAEFEWNTQGVFTNLVELPFPKCYTDKSANMGRNIVKNFGFLRSDAYFRIQLNGNRFDQGRLVCWLRPLTWSVDKKRLSPSNFANLAHVFLDASVSNSGVLTMPYTHMLTHFCIKPKKLEDDSMSCLCTLVITVLNKLRVGEGAPPTLFGTVYAKLDNPVLHQVCYTSDTMSFDSTTGYVDSLDNPNAPAIIQGEPGIWEKAAATGVGQALGNVLKLMTGGLATGVGNFLGGLIFDRPIDPRPVEPVLNRSVQPMCYAVGPDSSVRMGMTPISQRESRPAMVASNFDDMNFDKILQTYQLLYSDSISTSTSVKSRVARLPVCPTFIPSTDINNLSTTGVRYRPTALAYISRAFAYYEGSLVFKFQFVTSQFHSMRIGIAFDPLDDFTEEISYEQIFNMNMGLFDIQEQKEIEFVCPMTSTRSWLRCDRFRSDANFSGAGAEELNREPLNRSSMGSLSMWIVNRLVAPENVSQTIDFNIFIKAGKDFRLAIPVPLHPLRLTPAVDTFAQIPDSQYVFAPNCPPNLIGSPGMFENKAYIEYLYRVGRQFYLEGKLTIPTDGYWWQCVPNLQLGYVDDVLAWRDKASLLSTYTNDTPQWQYMASLLPYVNKWRIPTDDWAKPKDSDSFKYLKDDGAIVQGSVEVATTSREQGAEPIVPTRGMQTAEAAPTTISENAQNLQTVMRRYYPLYESEPIYNSLGYTLITVPVTPTCLTAEFKPYKGKVMFNRILHPIAYFSRLFNYWAGSLSYRIIVKSRKTSRKVYAIYDPRTTVNFRVLSGIMFDRLSHRMNLATVLSVSHLQGSVDVQVPWSSRYDQGLIELDEDLQDLRSQNGTLEIYIENDTDLEPFGTDPFTVSVFLSTGDDFVLNLYRGPTYIYECKYLTNSYSGAKSMCVKYPEFQYNNSIRDWGNYPATNLGRPQWPRPGGVYNFGTTEVQSNCDPLTPKSFQEIVKRKAGAFGKSVKGPSALFCPPPTITEGNEIQHFEELLEGTDGAVIQGLFADLRKMKNNVVDSSTALKNILTRVDETNLSEGIACLVQKANAFTNGISESVSTPAVAASVAKYSVLSAEILTVGAFIYSLKECFQNPNLKNFIMLSITAAGCIGFAVSNALQSVITNVVNWALSCELPQTQALDGATAQVIDSHSSTICTVVAVIATVFYAYIFDVLPSMTTLKEGFRKLFGDDIDLPKKPKAKIQAKGFELKNAHFSLLGITALDKVYTKCLDMVSSFLDWILERDNPGVIAARTTQEYRDRIMHCVNELDLLDNEEYFTNAMHDPFIHNRFYKLQGELNDLTSLSLREKKEVMDSQVRNLISECRKRCQKLIKELERDSPKPMLRYDPICICLCGESGTGKTKLMHKIADVIKEEMDLPRYNLIYPKGIKDEFWSGYKNQPIVFWDEFAQSRKMDEVIPEFMTLRGSTPVMLNMAALNDKGKYFTSQAMVLTTNVPFEDFNAVRDNNAFKRRRHLLIKLTHRPGFNAMNMQNARHDQFPNWEHCFFTLMNPMQDTAIADGLDLTTILEMVRLRVRRWHQNQMAILGAEDLPQEMPRGIVPIDNNDNLNYDEALETLALAEQAAFEAIEEEHLEAENEFHNPVNIQQDIAMNLDGVPREAFEALPEYYRPPPEVGPIVDVEGAGARIQMMVEDEDEIFVDCQESPFGFVDYVREEREFVTECVYAKQPVMSVYPWTAEEIKKVATKTKCRLFRLAEDCSEQIALAARSFLRSQYTQSLINKVRTNNLWIKAQNFCSELKQDLIMCFDKIKKTIYDMIENHPRIAKVVGAMTLFAGVGGVLYAFGNTQSVPIQEEGFYESHIPRMCRPRIIPESYEAGPDRAARPRIIPESCVDCEGAYEGGPARCARWRVVPEGAACQGCEDKPAMDIRAKVHPAVCRIRWDTTADGGVGQLNCTRIGGSLILLPYHFFRYRKTGDKFSILHRMTTLIYEYDEKRMFREGAKDWVLYDLGFRIEPAKHLFKYFVSEKNLVRKCNAILLAADVDGTLKMTSGKATGDAFFQYTDLKGDTYKQRGWRIEMTTVQGDCGGLLMGLGAHLPPPGKILGIHVAGYHNKAIGYDVLITREQLESLASKAGILFNESPIPKSTDVTAPLNTFRLVPHGDFTIVGTMDKTKRVFQPMSSDLKPTPWANEITDFPNPKKPAHLMPFKNADGNRISPLALALPKYGKVSLPLPVRSIDKIVSFLSDYLESHLTEHTGKRIFSDLEAVNGIVGVEYAERLNMKSSPGWPYQIENRGEPGKFHFFDEDGHIIDEKLQRRLDYRIDEAREGRRVASLWRDCLKDELRPIEKVDQGKTRLFTIAPLDFTIAVRKYFFDFVIAFYSAARSDFFSAVGIDPESLDWTFLYNRLREISDNAVAGDYSGFDGGLKPEAIEAICKLINLWYNDSPENQNVRRVLFLEMCHTLHLVNDCVYMSHQGNKSGNPLTVIINTLANLIYLLCAWIDIYPDRPIEEFFKWCRAIIYGDDLLITVSDKVTKFNQKTLTASLAKFGIVFTNEMKDDSDVGEFRSLDEVTFLKRGFRKDPEVGHLFTLPVMSEETLHSYLFWYRATEEEDEEQLRQNMRAALNFAFFRGRTFYEWYNKLWKECMRKHGFNPLSISYDEQLDIFLNKAGALGEIAPAQVQGLDAFMKASNNKWSRRFCGVTESIFYYLCAGLNVFKCKNLKPPSDDRWAVSIPSGEGKSTLCKMYPHIFVDHDELLLPKFQEISKFNLSKLPWRAKIAREIDFPPEDRRILLVHSPANTKRNLIGCFVTPSPTYIRVNIFHRLLQNEPYVMDFSERNDTLLRLARKVEPGLFEAD
ncbi:hypothetical protein [Hubei picorna-like virus 45]|uniref:hypothetical protein n=1 Tax=Hubei picorna-like virus 45 TaxID=1923126 RepID=UPI00090A5279|nr:hypothetical protein [Hubei picorna-like virus 45]APG77413.1 hypothetical protein [Hubei picorna-like virus 45]